MGIPHLYTHLRPYARPESFPPADGHQTPLYIDGPGLAHHIYHLALCSTPLTVSNPWEAALSYPSFEAAIITYLDLLSAASFSIREIYFDGHLPPPKRPTRLSRLNDSLNRLKSYHSLHPHTLRNGASHHNDPLDVLSPTATYTPRSPPLSAPPFILAAMIEALSAHPTYAQAVSTVPGEAESYCARDAIAANGVVLTGDSDLLLFAAPEEADWGVMMFKDVAVTFPGPAVSAVVFRPVGIARGFGVDLTFLGFLTMCDSQAGLGALVQRAERIEERKKKGVAVEECGRRWREFAGAYVLPEVCADGMVRRGVEPRIAEIVKQGSDGGAGGRMFLPFLWEDPTRGSAWDAGRMVRAAAYSLLFKDGVVEEVCRRGQRIAEGVVERVEDPVALVKSTVLGKGERWWVPVVLDEILAVFERRGQTLPEKSTLRGIAYMLSHPTSPVTTARKWTWERIQIYAMAQAAWYSLLLLKESLPPSEDDWRAMIDTLPGVAACIDGHRFLDGIALAGRDEKRVVDAAMADYHARLTLAREVEEAAEAEAQMEVDAGESGSGNGNGKRRSEGEVWVEPKKSRRGGKKREPGEGEGGMQKGKVGGGNMFAALAG